MNTKKKSIVFIIICCCLLTIPVFLSGPAGALTSDKVAITGKIPLVDFNISVSGISYTFAHVTWKTNANANGTVEYGTTTSYGSISTFSSMAREATVIGKDHMVYLYNLQPGTLYHYHVISCIIGSYCAVSADSTFTTPALPPTPPTPTPTPTPNPPSPPYYGGGGGGHSSSTFTFPGGILQQPGLPEQPQQQPGLVEHVLDRPSCQNEISQNYTVGFVGMLYNADDNNTLDLDTRQASASGATVTIDTDHIDVYQRESAGDLSRFWLDTSDIGDKTRIVKTVNSAELLTDPLIANFTTGTVSGSLHAIPNRILTPSIIRITLSGCIPPGIIEKIRNVSARNNLEPQNIAYTMNVEQIHLPETGPSDVIMTLPAAWVEQEGGTDSIHIARISNETGTTELLNTVFVGRDLGGAMIFRGESPQSTSLFAIFSAKPVGKGHFPEDLGINPLLLVMILIIIITALAVIVVYFDERRQKKS